nr:keratin-associated protein 15-1 [Symphalangus syndactylus]
MVNHARGCESIGTITNGLEYTGYIAQGWRATAKRLKAPGSKAQRSRVSHLAGLAEHRGSGAVAGDLAVGSDELSEQIQKNPHYSSTLGRIYMSVDTSQRTSVNVSYNCSSGNFSSCCFGGYLGYPVSTYNSFYPSNAIYSPNTCQLGSSVYNGCQETYCEPTSCQTSCTLVKSYQTSCYCPKNSIFCSPRQTNYIRSLGCGNTGLGSLGCGSTGFQSLDCGSSFYHPTTFSSRNFQATRYYPAFGSRLFGSTY